MRGVNRIWMKVNPAFTAGARAANRAGVGKFVREENIERQTRFVLKTGAQRDPRAARAGTQVHDGAGCGLRESRTETREDGLVNVAELEHELKSVRNLIAEKARKPGLLVNLKK